MSTLLTSPQPQWVSYLSDPLPGEQLCSHQHCTDRGFTDRIEASWRRRTFYRTWEGKGTLPLKTGGTCTIEQCAHLPCCHQLRSAWHEVRCGLCLPAAPEHHKAVLSQGSGCTQLLLMVSPKVHRLTLSLKLYVWKESFMGTPLLPPTALGHAHSCNQLRLKLRLHRQLCGCPLASALPLGISRTRTFCLWVLTVPAGCLALLPGLSSSSTGHTQKPFLPPEHRCPSWRNASCPATILLIWSWHTDQQCNITTGCSWSWGCTLWLLKGDFEEMFKVGFRSFSWVHFQYYFPTASYDHWDN